MKNPDEEILKHYGVRGMKWGVRRNRSRSSGSSGPSGPQRRSVKDLSDKELRDIVNRMNMEQQYSRMTAQQTQGNAATVRKVLAAGATINSVIAFSRSPAGRAITQSLLKTARAAVDTSGAVSTIGRF